MPKIAGVSHDGRGLIKHPKQKTIFVDQGLIGEDVDYRIVKEHKTYDEATIVSVVTPSSDRITPKCPYFGTCGGCQWQHMAYDAQLTLKQSIHLEHLTHQAKLAPQNILSPIQGPKWHYRHKVRLSVIDQDGKKVVGFKQMGSHTVIPIESCPVLCERMDLSTLASCSNDREVDYAIGTEGDASTTGPLYYKVKDLTFEFYPSNFIQSNPHVNTQMIEQVIQRLRLTSDDHVLDLYCGIGNFSLPIAQKAGHVTGVEGVKDMVALAKKNADANKIDNVSFYKADLGKPKITWPVNRPYTKLVLDPPRTGAYMPLIAHLNIPYIIYISCNSLTLARDARVLKEKGYELISTQIADMFPQTHQIESISVFQKTTFEK